MLQQYPSVEFVRQCVREKDGRLFWLRRPREHFKTDRAFKTWNTRFSGKEAGTLSTQKRCNDQRWMIKFSGGLHFQRYVIVWAIHTGEWHTSGLDHKNRNSLDDRFENLRPANQTQNNGNARRRRDNTSGFKGVSWHKQNEQWVARIKVAGRTKCLGLFADPAEAHAAYLAAAQEHFGEFACGG
jgi:hypothetical protein